jgi:hypothetical protein
MVGAGIGKPHYPSGICRHDDLRACDAEGIRAGGRYIKESPARSGELGKMSVTPSKVYELKMVSPTKLARAGAILRANAHPRTMQRSFGLIE